MGFSKTDAKMLKGIAICLMLAHHLFGFPERNIGLTVISLPFVEQISFADTIGIFGRICIYIFAVLGGYGTFISDRNHSDSSKYIACRLLELYRSYWRVFVIAVPLCLLTGMPKPEHFAADLIYCALDLRFSYCSEWWFITPFAILLIMYPTMKRFINRASSSVLSDALILVLFMGFQQYVLPELMKLNVLQKLNESVLWLEFYTTLGLLPAFVSGCLMAKYGILDYVKEKLTGKIQWMLIAILAMAAVFFIHPYNWGVYEFINASVFISAATILLYTKLGKYIGKIFLVLGNESTSMWLLHSLFCYKWCREFIYAPKYAPLIFLLLLLVSYTAARLLRFFYKYIDAFIEKKLTIRCP